MVSSSIFIFKTDICWQWKLKMEPWKDDREEYSKCIGGNKGGGHIVNPAAIFLSGHNA